MFWPATQPMDATIALFTTFAIIAICVIPVFSVLFRCRWWKLALFSMLMAFLMLPPSCTALWKEIDKARFGRFDYHRFEDVKDFRIERYLPPKATKISLYKHFDGNGYVARYEISEEDLLEYVDDLWEQYGEYSAIPREDLGEGTRITSEPMIDRDVMLTLVNELPFETVKRRCSSPYEGDGGGARYYFIPETGLVLQFSGYW